MDCPPGDTLRRLFDDKIGRVERDQLESHLETCTSCQDWLTRLLEAESRNWTPVPVMPPRATARPEFLLRLSSLAATFGQRSRRSQRGMAPPPHDQLPSGPKLIPYWPTVPGYEIQAEIGRGGAAAVYLSRHLLLGRSVALKVMLAGTGADQAWRFREEAEAVARLQHPNIVQVFEVGEADGRPFLALEYVDGGTLSDRLRGSTMPALAAAAMAETVARAVDAAHESGVVHRDLKPANILLTGDGIPKIADFGLARQLADTEHRTNTGVVLGTPSYMAPEQAAGRVNEIGPTADVYAMGVVLYEMLTGRPPFRGETIADTLQQLQFCEPVSPGRLRPNLPRDLQTICLKCLQKEPTKRYQTADDLADDLRRFLAGTTILARPVTPWERARKWARRRPAVAGLMALSAATVAGLLVTLVALWRHAEARAAAAQKLDKANLQLVERQAQLRVLEEEIRRQEGRGTGMLGEIRRLEAAIPAQQSKLREARVDVRRAVYIRDMHAAEVLLQKESVQQLVQVLEKHRPPAGEEDVRGPEWHYLWRLCHAERRALHGHREYVNELRISPDGKTVASRTPETWKMWDTTTGRELSLPWGEPDQLAGLNYSPNGKFVASGKRDGSIALWDVGTGRLLGAARGRPAAIRELAFSPDGKWLATCGADGLITLRDVPDLSELATWPTRTGPCLQAEFTPDGRSLLTVGVEATSGNSQIVAHLWEVGAGEIRQTFRARAGVLTHATVSPDGRLLAIGEAFTDGSFRTGSVRFWDLTTGIESRSPLEVAGGGAWALRFVPSGERLAVADNNGVVRFWDLVTRKVVATYLGNLERVHSIEFSRDGHTMATGGNDTVVRLWDLRAPPSPVVWPGQPGKPGVEIARWVFMSPNGQWLLGCKADGERWIWDLKSGRERRFRDPNVTWMNPTAFSPDSRMIADHCKDGLIRFRDVMTLEECCEPIQTHLPDIRNIAYTPDGQELAAVDLAGNVGMWELSSGKPKQSFRCPGHHSSYPQIFCLAFSPDGRFLATGGVDLALRVWDRATGAMVAWMKVPAGGVNSVAFSPDSKLLAAGFYSGSFMFWNTASFSSRHSHHLAAALMSAGMVPVTWAITASAVLDASFTPEQFHSRDAGESTGHIFHLLFTPDGKTLVVAHGESGVKIWDVAMRQERFTLRSPSFVNSAAMSACGRYLAGSGPDGSVCFWDIHSD
jgi:eukaryotic-like serine/threonine-protein kinase